MGLYIAEVASGGAAPAVHIMDTDGYRALQVIVEEPGGAKPLPQTEQPGEPAFTPISPAEWAEHVPWLRLPAWVPTGYAFVSAARVQAGDRAATVVLYNDGFDVI